MSYITKYIRLKTLIKTKINISPFESPLYLRFFSSYEFEALAELFQLELKDLKVHMTSAVLSCVVETFKETSEPLDRLVKVAIKVQVSKI